METEKIISTLEKTPVLLKDLLSEIPEEILQVRKIEGKWSIHEHAVHLKVVQPMLMERLDRFMNEERPEFAAYVPGKTTDPDELMGMDLKKSLEEFPKLRAQFTEKLRTLSGAEWRKKAVHAQLDPYDPYIMMRHVLLHDYTHMYRIEELWLSRKLSGK